MIYYKSTFVEDFHSSTNQISSSLRCTSSSAPSAQKHVDTVQSRSHRIVFIGVCAANAYGDSQPWITFERFNITF